jgi:hypothetical protein
MIAFFVSKTWEAPTSKSDAIRPKCEGGEFAYIDY